MPFCTFTHPVVHFVLCTNPSWLIFISRVYFAISGPCYRIVSIQLLSFWVGIQNHFELCMKINTITGNLYMYTIYFAYVYMISFRSTCWLFQIVYEREFWCLYTVSLKGKVDFLFIDNLKKPACASKQDGLVLTTLQ